jgi:beta-glucosidase-like glycosyl hydrolase
MVLFTSDLDADLDTLKGALSDGRLSHQRVDVAVRRVLALKAALGLHRAGPNLVAESAQQVASQLQQEESLRIAELGAAAAPTLVKEVNGLIPINIREHQRVVLVTEPSARDTSLFPVSSTWPAHCPSPWRLQLHRSSWRLAATGQETTPRCSPLRPCSRVWGHWPSSPSPESNSPVAGQAARQHDAQ